jgi:hypothetical protein
MPHFAEIDDNNIVLRVLYVDEERKDIAQDYLANECGLGGTWIETSYTEDIRGTYAVPGYRYDPVADIFIQKS